MLRRPITDEMMEETRLFTGRRVSEQGIGEGGGIEFCVIFLQKSWDRKLEWLYYGLRR